MGIAVAFRRGVPIVQVDEGLPFRRSEALGTNRSLDDLVLEPHQGRLPVTGVDHRSREGAVAAPDVAWRQRLRSRPASRRGDVFPLRVDRLHLGTGPRMRGVLQTYPLADRYGDPL